MFNPDDPLWTAYVLGELDSTELAACEAELASDPSAAQSVAALRRTIDTLTNELLREPCPTLTAAQRAIISTSSTTVLPMSQTNSRWSMSRVWLVRVLAASLLIAVGYFSRSVLPSRENESLAQARMAKNDVMSEMGNSARTYESTKPKDSSSVIFSTAPNTEPKPSSAVLTDDVGYSPAKSPTARSVEYNDSSTEFEKKGGPVNGGTLTLSAASTNNGTTTATKGKPPSSPTPRPDALSAPRQTMDMQKSLRTRNLPPPVAETPPPRPPVVALTPSTTETLKITGSGSAANTVQSQNVLASDGRGGRSDFSIDGGGNEKFNNYNIEFRQGSFGETSRDAYGNIPHNTATYDFVEDNKFLGVSDNPLSTFAVDVDTASYSNVRRFLTQDRRPPPKGAVRIEEMINYFRYDYAPPKDEVPFAVHTEVASCPWNPEHRLVKIGLKGREIAKEARPASNFVFLMDVSGSMMPANRLPMLVEAMKMLVKQLSENDRVAIVVYASDVGVRMKSTPADENGKKRIMAVLDELRAGGWTNGGSGITLAYETAVQNFIKGGTNRVILCTDGDFNVGITSQDELVRMVEEKAKSGVWLTTLGVGEDNLKDAMMDKLATKGHGNYFYLDDLAEAKKVLVEQLDGTLHTIAKDVKLQIEFNPGEVAEYRQIGYENRILAKEDFHDDQKLGGDIGAGHTVTALYEIVPVKREKVEAKVGDKNAADGKDAPPPVDPLKYQKRVALTEAAGSGELFTLKLRYKLPEADKSKLIETTIKDEGKKYAQATGDFKFAAAVASFGMILRDSPYKGNATPAAVRELAQESLGKDEGGYRAEMIELVKKLEGLK